MTRELKEYIEKNPVAAWRLGATNKALKKAGFEPLDPQCIFCYENTDNGTSITNIFLKRQLSLKEMDIVESILVVPGYAEKHSGKAFLAPDFVSSEGGFMYSHLFFNTFELFV